MVRQANNKKKQATLWGSLDWLTVFIYVVLLALGWMSVCGACYDFDQTAGILDFSTRSGMQVVWIGSSMLLAFLILMTDDRIFESLSYLIYIGFLLLLFVTPFLAHDIKGSLSWIKIYNFSVQPAEFAKAGVSLCLAKVMSTYGFDVRGWRDLFICLVLILLPMGLIVMQRETGSALVYSALLLVLYREGMPGSLLFTAIAAVVYFVVGVRYQDVSLWGMEQVSLGAALVCLLIQLFTVGLLRVYRPQARLLRRRMLLYMLLADLASVLVSHYVAGFNAVWVMAFCCGAAAIGLLYCALRDRALPYLLIALFTIGSLSFHYSADFVMNHVMEAHQQMRIRVLLGLEDSKY